MKITISDLIYDCARRCVTFSLYKNIEICEKVNKSLSSFLSVNFLLEVLLELRVMFEKSDPRYLLNRIFVDDYCTYLLNSNAQDLDKELQKIGKEIMEGCSKIKEDKLDLDLELQIEEEDDMGSSSKIDNDLENLLLQE